MVSFTYVGLHEGQWELVGVGENGGPRLGGINARVDGEIAISIFITRSVWPPVGARRGSQSPGTADGVFTTTCDYESQKTRSRFLLVRGARHPGIDLKWSKAWVAFRVTEVRAGKHNLTVCTKTNSAQPSSGALLRANPHLKSVRHILDLSTKTPRINSSSSFSS